ncbi:MAG: glycoside hydrolase family 3 protein [Sphaerochaetaceae bacterium]
MENSLAIGQRIIIGLHGPMLDDAFIELIRTYKIVNVVLLPRNIVDKHQTKELCSAINKLIMEETGQEAFIMVEAEGGMTTPLSADATHLPAPMAIGATADQGNAYTVGRILGTELCALGIHATLAPTLDINNNRQNPISGVRSYSDNPDVVASFGTAMVNGLKDASVVSVGKHFPGHGGTEIDSHIALPTISKTMEELLNNEIIPFRAAVEAGIPAIMTAHILYPEIEVQTVPATMSRTITTDLLRNSLQFEGVIIADCLEMGAIKTHYSIPHAAIEALHAGVDMVTISHSYDLVGEIVQAIQTSLENGYLNYDEHTAAVERIVTMKSQRGTTQNQSIEIVGSEKHRAVAKAIMERAICVGNKPIQDFPDLGSSPLFYGCRGIGESEVETFSEWMAFHIGGRAVITPTDPSNEEIIELVQETSHATTLVIGTYNGHLHRGQLALCNALAGTGLPTIVVALRDPYDLIYLAENIHSFAAFEYSSVAFEAIRSILTQERIATGILPVRW